MNDRLDLWPWPWPTDVSINRDHLLNKDFLPTKFEASWTKRSVVIRRRRCGETGITFDLDLWPTDLNINRGIKLIKDYLPTKLKACGAKRSGVISCTSWSRLAWPLTLTFDLLTWISIGGSSTNQGLSTYQVWSLWGKSFLSYQMHKVKGYRHTDRHTDRPTNRTTCAKQYAPPFPKVGGA